MVYLHLSNFDIRTSKDPVSFSQAIKSIDSIKWMDATKDDLKSMDQNNIWELIKLLEGYKKVGIKWVFKTKHDSRAISNDLKLDLWPKVSLRKRALITKRPSPLYPRRTHLESFWHW